MREEVERADELPDHYGTVVEDLIAFCGLGGGRVWVDLGSGGAGGGLALLEKISDGTVILVDPASVEACTAKETPGRNPF